MDRFFKKINQRKSLGQRWTPAHLDKAILKDRFLKNLSNKVFESLEDFVVPIELMVGWAVSAPDFGWGGLAFEFHWTQN